MRHIYTISDSYFSQTIEMKELSGEIDSVHESSYQPTLVIPPGHTAIVEQVPPRFGLIDDGPNRWPLLFAQIEKMNEAGADEQNVKLLFLVRHGEGFHNVAEAKYGTHAWDEYWSKLEGDGEITWGPDPLLTPTGLSQAKYTRSVWKTEVEDGGLTPPLKIYCSPFTRALKTCEIVFQNHFDIVTVIENCREENGVHTCDKRRQRSYISRTFADFEIEDSLTEEDELWDPLVRETKPQVAARAKIVIDKIWNDHPGDNFVAITAHSGFINGVLFALGAKPYPLPTGGVLPLVIRRVSRPDIDLGSISDKP